MREEIIDIHALAFGDRLAERTRANSSIAVITNPMTATEVGNAPPRKESG